MPIEAQQLPRAQELARMLDDLPIRRSAPPASAADRQRRSARARHTCRSALADVRGQATEQPAWEFGTAVEPAFGDVATAGLGEIGEFQQLFFIDGAMVDGAVSVKLYVSDTSRLAVERDDGVERTPRPAERPDTS